ncbi:MAG: YARHG domain-containing protein [Actinomycetaceae bacterium]|nr:YARHG domain-containing protein [Actinomycetaceae bacterium]
MKETISGKSTVLLALFAFVLGLGGFTAFHFASESAHSSQEVQDESTPDEQKNADDDPERIIILEREVPATQPSTTPAPSANAHDDYLVPDAATRQYSREELESFDNYQLYLARNEIFARHGMIFSDRYADLRDYFSKKSWYYPRYTRDEWIAMEDRGDKQLNAIEDYNAELMIDIEKARNSPYLN